MELTNVKIKGYFLTMPTGVSMIEETLTEQPNFLSCEGYTFYYTKQKLRDFNGEFYDINTGLSDVLVENNPELERVLEYFVELTHHLDVDEDIKEQCLDTLYRFLTQIEDVLYEH